MPNEPQWKILDSDLEILRDMAKRQREIAESPLNVERRELWYRHNDLQESRPLVLAEAGIAFNDMVLSSSLQCQEGWARGLERGFQSVIFQHDIIQDDAVVEPCINCSWQVSTSNYGVSVEKVRGDNDGELGSYRWEAPIKDIKRDMDQLHPRTYSVNREATLAWKAHLEEVFDGILQVRIRGGYWWTLGMTWTAIDLIGLENLMLFMYDDPEGLHQFMGFLRDDHIAYARWLQKEGLLTLNNENDYIGSGSRGYTRHLPLQDWQEGDPVRLRDTWLLSESQETVGVGPELFGEFIFPYQRDVIQEFGLCYYGCCEPVHHRWDSLQKLSNLRSVSVSPWCDQEFMAEVLARDYVFSRKPNPTLISVENFDEDAIRADLRETLQIARNCNLEIVMKDVHTLVGQPERLARWVALAHEEIMRV